VGGRTMTLLMLVSRRYILDLKGGRTIVPQFCLVQYATLSLLGHICYPYTPNPETRRFGEFQ
jgi:hypothetical protein